MKKSLLALAVLGSFAGVASAQTNVSIYGLVDAAIEYNDPRVGGSTWSMTDGNTGLNKNGSRLGFKGSEDLGGGLSAIFTLENGFRVDTGLSRDDGLFSRQAFVGLQGGFGAVKFGRQYTPMHIANDTIDPFGTGMAGAINRIFSGAGTRTSNTINYSLSAAGLTGQVAYTLGETAGDNSANRQIGLGLGYANGPINVQFAYHDTSRDPAVAASNDTEVALLGGTFSLGVAKLHAALQTNKAERPGTTATDARNWMLGATAALGAGEVRASFVRGDDRLAANADVDQLGVGYVHNLSKRTNVYTAYARQDFKRTNVGDNNVFQVGVQHKF